MKSTVSAAKNNQGFTLVELIIVIAVIAILTAVVAPKYITYIERSRISTDEYYISEAARSLVEVAAMNPEIKGLPATVTFDTEGKIRCTAATGATADATKAAIQADMLAIYPDGFNTFKSGYYKQTAEDKTPGVVFVLDENGKVTISGTKTLDN